MTFKRSCPKCDEDIIYTVEFCKNRAEKERRVCKKCALEIMHSKTRGSKRKKPFTEEHRKNLSIAHKKSKVFQAVMKSDGYREKLRKANTGRRHTEETKALLRKINIGRTHTKETKRKIALAARLQYIKRVERTGLPYAPNYNRTACLYFDMLNNYNDGNGVHAENGGEYTVKGYWLDYYEPNLNIVIEGDEPYHFNKDSTLIEKDLIRQKEIQKYLNCEFYRIKQSTMEISNGIGTKKMY